MLLHRFYCNHLLTLGLQLSAHVVVDVAVVVGGGGGGGGGVVVVVVFVAYLLLQVS